MEGYKRIENFSFDKVVEYFNKTHIPVFVDIKKKNIYIMQKKIHYFDWVYVLEDEEDLTNPQEIRIVDIMSGNWILITKDGIYGEPTMN